eukprot:TRINITY_DN2824_c0_g1_i1.p1 TRINITY_DN2824_c0_g1~~TRINITY_DN2824_c0_g1_i1.p1  ORF type:complete len:339 (+),score=126.03 TRINITY_DN2824_c0_g1_i1:78-1019(+)
MDTAGHDNAAIVNLSSKAVDLSKLRAGPDVCRALCDALETNQTVIDVDLSDNAIGDAGASHVASMLARNRIVRFLNLSRNNITDDGIIYIAKSLRSNSTLQVLSLSANPFGDKGAGELARALPHNSGLRELVLLDCEITHRGAVRVATGIVSNRSLLYLSLPFTVGHRLCDEIQRILRRNWREHNQVPERLAKIRALAEAEEQRRVNREASWLPQRTLGIRDRGVPPLPGDMTHWGDPATGVTMMYLHLLERKRAAANARAAAEREERAERAFRRPAPPLMAAHRVAPRPPPAPVRDPRKRPEGSPPAIGWTA